MSKNEKFQATGVLIFLTAATCFDSTGCAAIISYIAAAAGLGLAVVGLIKSKRACLLGKGTRSNY